MIAHEVEGVAPVDQAQVGHPAPLFRGPEVGLDGGAAHGGGADEDAGTAETGLDGRLVQGLAPLPPRYPEAPPPPPPPRDLARLVALTPSATTESPVPRVGARGP